MLIYLVCVSAGTSIADQITADAIMHEPSILLWPISISTASLCTTYKPRRQEGSSKYVDIYMLDQDLAQSCYLLCGCRQRHPVHVELVLGVRSCRLQGLGGFSKRLVAFFCRCRAHRSFWASDDQSRSARSPGHEPLREDDSETLKQG